jgi:hypothetical protein
MAAKSVVVSVSRWDKAFTTTFLVLGQNSMRKSKPMSLLTHWCWGIVARHWSRRNFRLKWSVLMRNGRPIGTAASVVLLGALDQPDEFLLVSGKLGMSRRQLAAEEGHRAGTLMEHDAQARAGGVAFHDNVAVEVRKL